MQLNPGNRMKVYIEKKEMDTINRFVYSNFNYYPLIWHFT